MHVLVCLKMFRISLRLLIFLHCFSPLFFGLHDLSWSVFCHFFLLPAQICCRAPLTKVFILFIVPFNFRGQPLLGRGLYPSPLRHWCFHPLLFGSILCDLETIFTVQGVYEFVLCSAKDQRLRHSLCFCSSEGTTLGIYSLPEHQDSFGFSKFLRSLC